MHGTARLVLLLACVYGLSYTIGHKLQVAHTELLSLAPDDAVNSSPSWIPYLELYQNVHSLAGRIAFLSGLTIWLLFLFSFIGIVASDFFCPNLSTISSKLGLSESVVRFLLMRICGLDLA
jgi:sodium/potassium/calcium exchanger 6